jgi:hypothetical protein
MTIELNQIHSPSNIGGISLTNNKLGMEKRKKNTSNSRWILTDIQSFVDIEENFFEESESLGLHLLALVKHFLHVLHVLGVI